MKFFITLLAFALLYGPSFAQSRIDSVAVFLQETMKTRQIPGLQVAVVQQGKLTRLGAYGLANLEHTLPVTDQSMFSINSMTKAFVGVAILQLSEQGKLRIEDPIAQYIDSLPSAWQAITIQQLLTHTSGLPDILDEHEHVVGNGQEQVAWEMVKALPIQFKPGERFSYNQTGYVILGKIINRLSGMPFAQFIDERQFKVAGMAQTRFGDSRDVIPHSAGGYTRIINVAGQWQLRDEADPFGNVFVEFPAFSRTSAGILSTAKEMANWLIALQTGKLLKNKASLQALWMPAVLNNGQIGGLSDLTNGYGLGWPTVTRAEHPAVAPVGGFRSALFVYLKDDLSIIVLTNLQGAQPELFIDELAGYYIPEMHKKNGFGLPLSIKTLRAELLKQGFQQAIPVARRLQQRNASFGLTEDQLNRWGYSLLGEQKTQEALEIFKLNVALYPAGWNVYDSLAEAYVTVSDKEAAIKNYQRSLALNPGNQHATDQLSKLRNQ